MGYSVAMIGNGKNICIGERWYSAKKGRVLCHEWDNAQQDWVQLYQTMEGFLPGHQFGHSLSMNHDGTRVAVGARYGGDKEQGTVRVFQGDPRKREWTAMGQQFVSARSSDQGGFKCQLNSEGNVLAWTARGHDVYESGPGDAGDHPAIKDVGMVRVAQWIVGRGGTQIGSWEPVGQEIEGFKAGDNLGESVALSDDGKTLAASSNLNNEKEYVTTYSLKN